MNDPTELPRSVINYDGVYSLLKNLDNDPVLENSAFKNLSLVKVCRRNNPLFSNSQAIRRVFTDVLNNLAAGSEKHQLYAYILKGRFWDNYSIVKMTTSGRLVQMAPRTFSNEQKKAITSFCETLTALEQQCIKDNPELDMIQSDDSTRDNSDVRTLQNTFGSDTKTIDHKGRNRLFIAIFSLLVIFSLINWFITRSTNLDKENLSVASLPATSTPEKGIGQQASTPELLTGNICKEKAAYPVNVADNQFIRSQGIIIFNKDTTPGIINNKVRTLQSVTKGVWLGYFGTEKDPSSGVGFYDRENKRLLDCSQTGITEGENINDIEIDRKGTVWIGMEKGGIASYNGSVWRLYKTEDGLPSNWIYGLYVDNQNNIWAATYKGIARFDGARWNLVYSVENNSLINDRTHIITMDSSSNIWVGYIENGVSVFHPSTGKWEHFTRESGDLSGNKIRNIVVQPGSSTSEDTIWIATLDNGISQFRSGKWTSFTEKNGLPSNEIRDIALDKYDRLWAATDKGVYIYTNGRWSQYDRVDTVYLTFGVDCKGKEGYCLNDEEVFTGTSNLGITHSRIPLPDEGLDVLRVCFITTEDHEVCPDLVRDEALNTVIVNYPQPLKPGDKFFMKAVVSPHNPYKLLESRGDMLIHVDADSSYLYGAFERIPVAGSIESGQEFAFIDTNNPFVAPVPEGSTRQTYFSTWRVWMQTRLIGPNIRVSFTVEKE